MSLAMVDLFFASFGETLLMVGASSVLAALLGLPLGLLLHLTGPRGDPGRPRLHRALQFTVSAVLSTPSVVLLAGLIALAHVMLEVPANLIASVVPLALIVMPGIARSADAAFGQVDNKVVDAAKAAGASTSQMVYKVFFPSAAGGIAAGLGMAVASLVGYSTLAGAISGQGLGDLGLRYGFQEFMPGLMLLVVLSLLVLAEAAQFLGHALAHRLNAR